jgi:hypothetical protein
MRLSTSLICDADVLCTRIPNVVLAIDKALAENDLEGAYRVMPTVDLSREVFAPQPHRLLTIHDATSGWADLGSPTRVMEILARSNTHLPWLREGRGSVPLSADSYRDRAFRHSPGQDFTDAGYQAKESLDDDKQNRSI